MKSRTKRADELFSKLVRARDQACVRCGSVEVLQAAHVIKRRYRAVRWDPRNCHALCRACHMWETHRPLEGEVFWRGWDSGSGRRGSRMSPLEDLRAQRTAILEGRWVQWTPVPEQRREVCAVVRRTPSGELYELDLVAARALLWAIAERGGGWVSRWYPTELIAVMNWNDGPGRKLSEVIEVFDRAEVILKECGYE